MRRWKTQLICSLLAPAKHLKLIPENGLPMPYYTRDRVKDLKELLPNYWKQRNSKEI